MAGSDGVTGKFATPGLLQQLLTRLAPAKPAEYACFGFSGLDLNLSAETRSFVADSYPRNHTYTAQGDQLTPRPKLASRVARLTRRYPDGLSSFIDLSCSKGFFVFHAAMQPGCRRSLGIDLDDRCLDVCRELQQQFTARDRVNFARLTLQELAERIDEFGGPFQTALLVNTYQYLVFGSGVAPRVSSDHREIFRLLRRICSGRLVFHNRLRLNDLQDSVQGGATSGPPETIYEPGVIAEAASEFFKVHRLDCWSKRPVWLLDARAA
jgi:hypothetical protein